MHLMGASHPGVKVQSVINGKVKVVTPFVKELTEKAATEDIEPILLFVRIISGFWKIKCVLLPLIMDQV